ARLTRLYFRSHGPATLQDFVWWSGLSTADAKRGMELVERSLEKQTIEETVYWSIRSDEALGRLSSAAHLLPVFDEYFVAYKEREIVFAPQDGRSSWDTLGPAIVINGVAAGTWKRTNDKKPIELKFTRTLKKTERAVVTQAAAQYAEFLGLNRVQVSENLFR
ncbi:MAG TPA: crosslink repair DNA glycosylase YcaQ family protein, partial [Pyrinomonadaceae bacterium]|nr:crosslink repair DNA glycosylase YcaQ family protein [Pyrinomonadaceae bacterium]